MSDDLVSIKRAIENKLTSSQIKLLKDLNLSQFLQQIKKTKKIPTWLIEIVEIFKRDPNLSFLVPRIIPPVTIPPVITPPEVIGPEFKLITKSPSSDYEDCAAEAQNFYNSNRDDIEYRYNNIITQIEKEYNDEIIRINQEHSNCTTNAKVAQIQRDKKIAVLLAVCEGEAAVLGLFCFPCGIVAGVACAAAAAFEYSNSNELHQANVRACNNAKAAHERAANDIYAQAKTDANSERRGALEAARNVLQDSLELCRYLHQNNH